MPERDEGGWKREEDFTREDLERVWNEGEPVALAETIQFRGWVERRVHKPLCAVTATGHICTCGADDA